MRLPVRQDPARVAELASEVKRLSCEVSRLTGTLRGIGAILAAAPVHPGQRRDASHELAELRSTLRGIGAVLSVVADTDTGEAG